MCNTLEEQITQVNPAKWRSLELFRTVYPGDEDFDKLDVLYPGRIGYIYKKDDGSIEKIVIAKVWPHKFGEGDEDETALFGPGDQ